MKASGRQPAASPDPVAGNRIHNQADGRAVHAVRFKIRPLRHGARHNGGRGGAEHRLENGIAPNRQRTEIIASLNQRVKAAD